MQCKRLLIGVGRNPIAPHGTLEAASPQREERAMNVVSLCLAALAAAMLSTPASALHHAPSPVEITLVDRESGAVLPTYRHRGERFVPGTPGHRYAIRVTNRTGARVLAVMSVDGVNIVTGETADPAQSGYVLGPYETAEITGWRKSMDDVAAFVFTDLADSYAARTGRPDDVGVVGVAVFHERVRMPQPAPPLSRREAPAAAGSKAGAAPHADAYAESEAPRQRIGTGHGGREHAPTRYTGFERASRHPAQLVALRYDSRENLALAGVIDEAPRWPYRPRPFPAAFVPDPPPRW